MGRGVIGRLIDIATPLDHKTGHAAMDKRVVVVAAINVIAKILHVKRRIVYQHLNFNCAEGCLEHHNRHFSRESAGGRAHTD